ncbi:MAG TPA: glucose 1-dehydrogenase [Trueperaceae bacterium]|nr:glucose 1-dehydrogenase [Trueperaceae bacterium]
MTVRLDKQVAVVTGSDSGIGQAIAIEFAREGADVAVTYHTDEDGARETERLVLDAGGRAIVLRVDVTSEEQVEGLFAETLRRLGTPSILVNNAGMGGPGDEVADLPTQAWRRVIETNLFGPFYGCRRFVALRREAGGGGKVVNVTSVHEHVPTVGDAAYDVSKGGLRNLTRTLALEAAKHKVNVNAIAPGMILTPMNEEAVEDLRTRARAEANIPWRRAGEPWEVAKLAVYLASSDADYVTGQTFVIDGGLSLHLGQGA